MDPVLGIGFNQIDGKTLMHPYDLKWIEPPFMLEAQYFVIEVDGSLQITNVKNGVIQSDHWYFQCNT